MSNTRRLLITWLLIAATAVPIGMLYAVLIDGDLLIGASIAFTIAAGITGLEMFFIQRRAGESLRRMPLPAYIAIASLLWLLVIVIGLQVVPALFLGSSYFSSYAPTDFARDTLFAFGISLFNNSIYRIRSLVGPGVFMRFLFGRYHRPKRESRVFIFLDLADSTQLAEQLGDLEVQSLISRFFFDIAQPVNRHRGETHRYIGDEVVITWPLEKAIENARCIRCVLDIQTTMQKRADWYQRKFGLVPRFRIGMHGGPIVASEIGDHKREIVYFGDTINTAARLCSACKELGTDILISQSLTEQITLPGQTTISEGRKIHLAGKSEPVEVVSITNTQ